MNKLFLLLLPISLFCTNSEPLTFEVGAGYRRDEFCLKVLTDTPSEDLVVKEKFTHLNYLQAQGTLKAIERDFYMLVNGGAAFLGNGSYSQKFNSGTISTGSSEGMDYFGKFLFGYQANLFEGRLNKLFITPLVGYEAIWKELRKRGAEPEKIKERFWGPILGADINFQEDRWGVSGTYLFHWLALKSRFKANDSPTEYKFRTSSLKTYAHQGIVDFAYYAWPFRVDLAFSVQYLSSCNNQHASTKILDGGSYQKVKNRFLNRWTFISALLEVGYRF